MGQKLPRVTEKDRGALACYGLRHLGRHSRKLSALEMLRSGQFLLLSSVALVGYITVVKTGHKLIAGDGFPFYCLVNDFPQNFSQSAFDSREE
jgi:hypothetical protein